MKDIFCINFDLLLNNLNDESLYVPLSQEIFNACCSSWWKNDITNTPGQEIDSLSHLNMM